MAKRPYNWAFDRSGEAPPEPPIQFDSSEEDHGVELISDDEEDPNLNHCAHSVLSLKKEILMQNAEFRYASMLYYCNDNGISTDFINLEMTGFDDDEHDRLWRKWIQDEGEGYDDFFDALWQSKITKRKWTLPLVPDNPFLVEHHFVDPTSWKMDELFWACLIHLWTNQLQVWLMTGRHGIKAGQPYDVMNLYSNYKNYEEWVNQHDTEDLILAVQFVEWLSEPVSDDLLRQSRQEQIVKQWQFMNRCSPTVGNGVPTKLRSFIQQVRQNYDKYLPVIRVDQQIYCQDKDFDGKIRHFFIKVSIYLHLRDIVQYYDTYYTKGKIEWHGDFFPNFQSYFAKIIFEETMLEAFNIVSGHISGSGDVVKISLNHSTLFDWVEMAMSEERWSEIREKRKHDAVNPDSLQLMDE